MRFSKTILLATTAICLGSFYANATETPQINQVDGVVIDSNNDAGANGEYLQLNDANQTVFQANGGGNGETANTTVKSLNNVVINGDASATGGGSVALQVDGHTGLEVHADGSGNVGSITMDGGAGGTSISGSGGVSASGGTISLNQSSNNNTNINTGTSTGTVNIGTGTGNNNIGNGTGNTTIVGATASVNATGTGNTNIGNATGIVGILGATNINTAGSSATTDVGTGGTGVVNIGNTTGGTAITGALSQTGGTANINASSNNNTNINTGTSTGTVSIGNSASTTDVTGATNINTSGSAITTIGSTTGTTNINGTSTLTSANTFNSAVINNTGVTNTASNGAGNVATSALLNTGLTNTVTNGAGLTSTSAQTDAALTNTVTGATTNSQVSQTASTANVLVTNNLGNTHGLSVGTSATTLSGGTSSTTLTLDNNGATFAGTGGVIPAQVHGVANGTSTFDAVNLGQLDNAVSNFNKGLQTANAGIASVSAMSNIPQVDPGKKFSLGLGYGYFQDENAVAFGGSVRVAPSAVVKASFGTSGRGDNSVGAGVAYSW